MSAAGNQVKGRLWSLMKKELRQIRRDRRLMLSLVVPPTLMILLFGFALSPNVRGLKLGVADYSQTQESRELIAVLSRTQAFVLSGFYTSEVALQDDLVASRLDLGIVIPRDFAKQRLRGESPVVQVLLNAVNANTAQIAQGYTEATVAWFNQQSAAGRLPVVALPSMVRARPPAAVIPRVAFLYNPGLVTAWFIVTGVFGLQMILSCSLIAAGTMIREKESGTIEQLLMTPADALEIVLAKMTPLFLLMMISVALVITTIRVVFHVPLRGNFLLLWLAAALCVLAGIGLGTMIATFAKTAAQTQLISFFVNPPIAVLSGAMTPVEAMPAWLQPWTQLNPVRHFAIIARGVMVKGSGMSVLYPHFLALLLMSLALVTLSAWRFRRQLS
jgi:ABC-2 type transport system permease protein